MIKLAASLFLFVLAACTAEAQTLKLPASLDKLAAKAKEVVDIKLDANTLRSPSSTGARRRTARST